MKLKDYIAIYADDDEIICYDKDIVGEYYFYKEMLTGKPEPDFPNVYAFNKYLIEHLDIQNIHQRGITLNLYEFLNKPTMIDFAKEKLYTKDQYENNEDVALLLYDDVLTTISQGIEEFSETMVKYFENNDKVFQFMRKKELEEAKRHYMIAVDLELDEKDSYIIYVEMPGRSNSKEVVNKALAEGLFKKQEDVHHISGIAFVDKETYFANQSKNNVEINTYKIPVVYQSWGLVDVEAQSLDEAIEYAEDNLNDLPLPDDPQYVEDSYEIDYEGIYAHNNEKNYSASYDAKNHISKNTFKIEGKSLDIARAILEGDGENLAKSLIYKDFRDSVLASHPYAAGFGIEFDSDNKILYVFDYKEDVVAVISKSECVHKEDFINTIIASNIPDTEEIFKKVWSNLADYLFEASQQDFHSSFIIDSAVKATNAVKKEFFAEIGDKESLEEKIVNASARQSDITSDESLKINKEFSK